MTLDELERLLHEGKKEKVCLLDIRGETAFRHGCIPGARLFDGSSADAVHTGASGLAPDLLYVVYCTYGADSIPVTEMLREHGLRAASLEGGYGAWLQREMKDWDRYERQMILPEIGVSGQRKLKDARVLIVGAGGLGSPAAQYLAGAGVGTIGIMDADDVSLSNLHRQVIHPMSRLGENKAQSARSSMLNLNDRITVKTYPFRLTPANAAEIIRQYDFVLDCVDNFETKFLINDACVLSGTPFCHAGILRFQGQVMTYVPGQGPCYRCIFGEIPEAGSIPTCSQAGIIGAVAGIIGCVQALEAIKYITGAGDVLTGKMFILDGLTMKIRLASFPHPSPDCRVCGPSADIRDVGDQAQEYESKGSCGAQRDCD